jgi:hypothetical protein
MTQSRKPRKLPFWKRWFYTLLLLVTVIMALVFVTMTFAMPFLYETDANRIILYAMGMSLLMAGICADSARRIYRRIRPK